jgi:geranylgeranyl reductase family protein
MESYKTDVLIIGAGPGGTSAAIRLAKANVNVTLVDKCQFPRAKVCGDGLTPKAITALQGLGVETLGLSGARKFNQVSLVAPDNSVGMLSLTRLDPRTYGVVVPRRELDGTLVEQAIRAGTRFMPELHINEAIREDGRVCGARGDRRGRTMEIQARLTVAADGAAGGFTARIGFRRRQTVREVAMRTYFANVNQRREGIRLYFDRQLLPAYGWLFPLGNGMANVGVGLEGRALKRTSLSSAFHAFVQKHPVLREDLRDAHMLESPHGFPLRSTFDWKTSSVAGVLLAGDAAGLVHPFTGEGIRFALESGELAAAHVYNALTTGDVSLARLKRYAEALKQKYGGMHRTSNMIRSAFHSPWIAQRLLSAWADPVGSSNGQAIRAKD